MLDAAGPTIPPSDAEGDPWLFSWDPTPGIVSVWASSGGRALLWQRLGGRISCSEARFRPWLLASTLDDLYTISPASIAQAPPELAGTPVAYCELAGEPGSYRYLISAQNSRFLERALLEGAARRYGRPIASIHDLDEYYRVGMIEQYLMQSGRVYFRGMTYDDLHRLQFDLETTALDPRRGRIFMAAVRDNRGLERVLEAPLASDERALIEMLCSLIQARDPDVIENHNLYGFDLPFLEARAAALGVPLMLGRTQGPATLERYEEPLGWGRGGRKRTVYSLAGRELIDTLEAVRRYNVGAYELTSYRLKHVAKHFGVASPERVYLPGSAIYETYRRDPATVRSYALDDVREVDALSQRLLGAAFALAGMAPRRYCRLVSAGPAMGILEPMLVRAYLRARSAPPRGAASGDADLPGHAGGASHLFASGVAERVVKADIASMYPSLMRTYQIGPACDRLGVLLHLVDRLTTLRLAHKEAARQASAASAEAAHHGALQLAMKLLINSAYGYLGAGSMALFADRHAADEITRRGRAILDQVVAALRARGVQLIEADTDGVYFAVPEGWSEQQERELVSLVGAELPPGIHLEYEGRYASIFSYEIKNYALLAYDGRLVVRGAALRSSRSEPFGERFLRQALPLAMRGDSAALHALFQQTVAAISARELPAADMATRVRLSKSAELYLRGRKAHREAPYEALLAAGRQDWQPGERVRFYRAADGSSVWLPDESDEPAPANDEDLEDGEESPASLDEPAATARPVSGDDRRDYDVAHYLQVLLASYAGRLRKAFAPEDFDQLFRIHPQLGLFDKPVEQIKTILSPHGP